MNETPKYTDPSTAIKDVLDRNGFNESAMDTGVIELRIIAAFGKDGCAFYRVGMSHVELSQTEPPKGMGTTAALRALADVCKVPSSTYLLLANSTQMGELSTVFDTLTPDEGFRFIQDVVDAHRRDRFVLAKNITKMPAMQRAAETLLYLMDTTP